MVNQDRQFKDADDLNMQLLEELKDCDDDDKVTLSIAGGKPVKLTVAELRTAVLKDSASRGGSVKSEAKAKAARESGKKGGRPRKEVK